MLDNSRRQPIVWISGPGGSGKTTLAAHYLDERKVPCLWYQVDASDADPATFFYYMGLAAKKAAPRYRKPLPLLTPEYLQGLSTFSRRFFENLYTRLKPPFAIVFDNYQEAQEQSPLQDLVNIGLSLIPDGIQVFVVSRKDPPPQFMRLRANNAIQVVGWDELRFTLDETKQFIRRKEKLTEDAIEEMHEKTEGWAAGLVLMMEKAGTKTVERQSSGGHLQPEVFDYFAGEVFDKLNAETRDFLLATAFLPAMSVRAAEKMTGRKDAGGILAALNRSNFFTGKISGPAPAYRFHPLFRAFLQARVTETLSREGVLRLREKTAQLLIEDGQIEDAIALLYLAEDWNSLVPLILSNAQSLIMQGRNMTLQEWIEWIPRDTINTIPWLLYWHAICRMPFNLTECRENLESAFELFKKENNRDGLLLSCSGILDTYAVAFSNFTQVDRWINELEDIVKRFGGFPSPALEIRITFIMFTILYMRQPDHPRFSFWHERALSLMQSCGDNSQRVINATFLLHYYSWIGFPADTPAIMKDLRLRIGAPDVPIVIKIIGRMVEGIHGWCTASFEASRKAIAGALEMARYHGLHHYECKLLAHEVYRSTIIGDCSASSDLMQKLAAATDFGKTLDATHYYLLASFDARCRDDFAASLEHARTAEKLADTSGAPFPLALCRYNLSQALFDSNNVPEARGYLEKALQTARMMKSVSLEFSCLLLEALFAYSAECLESEKKALRMLHRAMSLGRAHNIMNVCGWRRKTLSRLCSKAFEAGIETDYARKIVRTLNLVPDNASRIIEAWPWPLKIYTLGRFELVKDGEPVKFSGKVQQKPLALLKALVAFGGKDVAEEHFTDALWPDVDGDLAHKSFEMTVQRLRRLIGMDRVIQLQERRLSLDSGLCRVDAWELEDLIERVDKAWKGGLQPSDVPIEAVRLSEKALSLYKGHFLPNDSVHAWALSYRERLRSKFLRLIIRLGGHWEQHLQWQKAVEVFQKGLEVDGLAEEFYQHLMMCYHEMGQRAEAASVYNRCRTLLVSSLGIPPSRKTEDLYQSIKT